MKEYVLLLGANQYLRERAFSGAKSVTHLPIWSADVDPIKTLNRYFDHCIKANSLEAESLLSVIAHYHSKGWTPRVVIPLNDWTLKSANEVNQRLGLRHLSEQTTELARNKFAMKQAFQKSQVKTAAFILIKDEKELLSAVDKIGLPVVIKPYDFGGSGGVYLARTESEALQALQESQALMHQYAKSFRIEGDRFLVEQYIASPEEVSVEVLCYQDKYHVVTVTEKYLSPEPWFAEMAHLVPSHRAGDTALQQLACQACKALGIEFGMVHVEIKIKDGEGWVIEVGARPGGDGIMDQIERAYEINPYSLHVSAYLGQDPFPLLKEVKPLRTAAIAFLKAAPGKITAIQLPDKLPDSVRSFKIQAEVGAISEDPICWRAREGVVEYTWDQFFMSKSDLPLSITQDLAAQIFMLEEV
jgi:biotin carboxylase